ncbi:putative endo-beta-N-acetylglucosaminidase precursor [Clostridium puniceum]|uniref:Putative endo-beta-N-acetylglucosaminidase n=1 Tax=Clostridium puniceum TaxID=29367 RepID=A0A1S8TFA9_9CLOT|nr:N-acetylmuramoyl-L-alanine amidase family protein [Clostridium puniceum]OOM76341.1 putative endo-beta-N-acetylglucosaminidase precursor [Clostridium puniceum]
MFKRANKITALVVAAASIMSVVPAMAVEKLGTKDGTVTEGVAFDNGNYAYYGYRTDDDDTGIWYNGGKGEKDKAIEDLEDYELHTNSTKYGEKYAYVTENGNSDEYLVDLSNGKIADEDTPEDQEASAKAKLISALKKAERYNNTSDDDHKITDSDVSTERLFKNQFGELWYQYTTTSANSTLDDVDGAVITTTAGGASYFGGSVFTGFTNTSGKYIDASYLANLKVYNARKNKATVIEQFGKIYKDEALKVDLKGLKSLAQDKDYIYALATVDVTYYPVVNGAFDFSEDAAKVVTPQYFIQKISKERDSSKEDGAYVPKSVDSWQVDDGSIFDVDDDNDVAFKALTSQIDGQTEPSKYAVKDGVLYVTLMEDKDTVHVYKLKLGKDKRDLAKDTKLTGSDLTELKSKLGEDIDMTIVTLDEDDDADASLGFESVSIDVDGNTWTIDDGEISMFDGDEFKVQYKTDRSFDRLDVYNKDSLIAWEDGEDAYTTVQEGKDQTVSDGDTIEPRVTTPATVGWKQEATGWTFYDVNGAKVASKWVNDNGTWYYIKADGIMATGWYNDNGTWYFLKGNGAMATGWYNDNGTWYYLAGSGAMLANTTVDGYQLGASGAWIQ